MPYSTIRIKGAKVQKMINGDNANLIFLGQFPIALGVVTIKAKDYTPKNDATVPSIQVQVTKVVYLFRREIDSSHPAEQDCPVTIVHWERITS